MPNFQRLANPPIKEAILWVRTNRVADKSVSLKDLVPKEIEATYPKSRQQFTFKATFGLTQQDESEPDQPSKTSRAEQALLAELRESEDATRTVSIRRDGVSYSALRGRYESWEEFVGEFHKIWRHFRAHNNPTQIRRVSTRFINEIRVPINVGTPLVIEDWFQNPPKVPKGLPDTLNRFTLQIEVPCEDDYLALLNLVTIGVSEDGRWAVILDVDISRDVEVDAGVNDIWSYFDELRRLKNIVFFGSLTERTLELYR